MNAMAVPKRKCFLSSVQFSHSVVSNSLRPHESQHTRPPCPSPTHGVHSNSRPSSGWCHPAISSSVIPFSSCPQSLPGSGSFPMSQLFAWGGQSTGVSALASFFPKNTQDSKYYLMIMEPYLCKQIPVSPFYRWRNWGQKGKRFTLNYFYFFQAEMGLDFWQYIKLNKGKVITISANNYNARTVCLSPR